MSQPTTSLAGQVALVTGAARRIGRATALALADNGVSVVLHYRSSRHDAEQLAGQIGERGVRAWTCSADLADPQQTASLFDAARHAAGPVDILVNNASIFPSHTLAGMTPADLATNMQVNAVAPLVLAQALARQERPGSIVNLLDTRIVHHDAAHAAYHVSKRALFTLTRMMATEFAPRLRVNAVAPGLILPPPGEDESYLERYASNNPLQQSGSVDDVTEAILYLLRATFVTGQVIFVDGGYHMKGRVYGC